MLAQGTPNNMSSVPIYTPEWGVKIIAWGNNTTMQKPTLPRSTTLRSSDFKCDWQCDTSITPPLRLRCPKIGHINCPYFYTNQNGRVAWSENLRLHFRGITFWSFYVKIHGFLHLKRLVGKSGSNKTRIIVTCLNHFGDESVYFACASTKKGRVKENILTIF